MSKYTEAMETAIREAAPLDYAKCQELADTAAFASAEITARGIAAKARTMGVEYKAQERVSKDGSAIVRKDELVDRISDMTGEVFQRLDKAGKADLQKLVTFIEGLMVAS